MPAGTHPQAPHAPGRSGARRRRSPGRRTALRNRLHRTSASPGPCMRARACRWSLLRLMWSARRTRVACGPPSGNLRPWPSPSQSPWCCRPARRTSPAPDTPRWPRALGRRSQALSPCCCRPRRGPGRLCRVAPGRSRPRRCRRSGPASRVHTQSCAGSRPPQHPGWLRQPLCWCWRTPRSPRQRRWPRSGARSAGVRPQSPGSA